MKTTQADFDFWLAKQMERAPAWARGFRLPVRACVDRCINARANPGKESESARALHNLRTLLGGVRRNIARGAYGSQTLPDYLAQLIRDPGTICGPKERSQWAARFVRGLRRGESRRVS